MTETRTIGYFMIIGIMISKCVGLPIVPHYKRQYIPYGNYPGGYGVDILGQMTEDWSNDMAERITKQSHLVDEQGRMVEHLANTGSNLVDHESHIVAGDGGENDPELVEYNSHEHEDDDAYPEK